MRLKVWAGILACAVLAACAENRPNVGPTYPLPPPVPPIRRAPPPPPPQPLTPPPYAAGPPVADFAQLPGWAAEDHAAALAAFAAGCGATHDADMADLCRRARAAGPLGEAAARAFFEDNFRLDPIPETGLLTAYFSPVYPAAAVPDESFYAPVRPRPPDLSASHPPPEGAYADRAAIEARPAPDAIAWMRPEDLFFLQIQGSGVLVFPDGRRARAVFDGTNGARFTPIAAPMRQQGLLAPGQAGADAIRGWLADHRGAQADAIMRLNPRFVFFRLAPDDGREPVGAAGAPLVPGRAIAVDPDAHAMGELDWIDGSAPTLAGAFPTYRRLVMALDTGGAIKGRARADLYLGRGDAAGAEAGRVRHALRLYRLSPIGRAEP